VKEIPLRRLLNKHKIRALLEAFANLSSSPVTMGVAGIDGKWLVAYPSPPTDYSLVRRACDTQQRAIDEHAVAIPFVVEETLYGALYSSHSATSSADVLCQVLETQIQSELLQKALAKETLERYREINLLYRVHETIGSSLDLYKVVRRMLKESIRIIKADGGSVLLSNDLTNRLMVYDSVKLDVARAEQSLIGQALSEKVFQAGKSSILNDLQHYIRPKNAEEPQLVSLLCAPLKSTEKVLGVIALGRGSPGEMFTAGDEKLLTALASQAGIAIANAREVQARELRLKQQIKALRIEIDEAKQQKEVFAITESEYFTYLQENARQMRAEFDI
jgi:GAF domain-containing protein